MKNNHNKENISTATYLMLIIIFFSSLTPLFLNTLSSQESPLWFTTITRITETVISITLLLILKKELFSYQVFKEIIIGTKEIKVIHHLTIATFSCIDIIIFSIALRFIDISTATIFYELWAITFIIWTSFLFHKEKKYKQQTIISYILLIIIFLGLVLTIIAESETNPFLEFQITWETVVGISIAFFAGTIAAIGTAHNIKYCYSISKLNAITNLTDQLKPTNNNLYCILLYLIISRSIITMTAGITAYLTYEPISNSLITYATVFGFTLLTPTILFSFINLTTSNLNINALYYITPALALLWLILTEMVKLPHPNLLITGAATIIIGNILLNLKTAISPTHKISIITLWTCLITIYLYHQFTPSLHTI